MRVCADLGRLQESRRLPNHPLYASTTVRWEENYSLSLIEVELPDEGSRQSELNCPVCSEGLRLKLVSVKRIQTLLTFVALAFVALVVCGLGLVLISVGAPEYPLLIPGLIAFGIGGLAMLAAIVAAVIKPDFLARTDDAIKIVKDQAREQDTGPGFSGMRGHKLFNVRGGSR